MALVKPFAGLRPVPKFAAAVIAPPYDVVSTEEARVIAADRPYSFLHISKPEIDLPKGTDPYSEDVYAKGAENLQRLRNAGVLCRDSQPCFYLYRLSTAEHQQTGIVALASVEEYKQNIVRKHEYTIPKKQRDRVDNMQALNAQTGPVFMTYRDNDKLSQIISSLSQQVAIVDETDAGGVRHEFWVISENQHLSGIQNAFAEINILYIADGHHRSAAAAVTAEEIVSDDPTHAANYFLTVLFPHNQVKILGYHRIVKDLNGLSADAFKSQLAEQFTITPLKQARPAKYKGEWIMALQDEWYSLSLKSTASVGDEAIAKLDVSVLTDYILQPLLNITDQRSNPRIEFVGGTEAITMIEEKMNQGNGQVAFMLYPTRVDELLTIADAQGIMPPKSTWFEPKLADGLVSYLFD